MQLWRGTQLSIALRLLKPFTKMGVQIKMHFVHFFGQYNRPNVYTIERIVRKFQQTGCVENMKTPVHARPVRPAIVCDSVTEESSTSTRRRAQQLTISQTSLMRILNKDLSLHAYKVQLNEELKSIDHFKQWSIRRMIG